jgi:ribonuclease J
MHGTDGHLTREFVERLAAVKPDIFLCEGTRIDEADRNSESYVRENSMRTIADTKGLVIADFAFKDTARFKTFLDIARTTGRKLAIEFRDAYYVRELSGHVDGLPDLRDESLLLYEGKKSSGTYREGDYEEWEREFLDFPNTVRADYITKHQGETIAALGYYDVPELVDIRPEPGSLYIKSASEAFNEEQKIDMERLRAWLEHFKMRYAQIHASGHAPRNDLGLVMKGSGAKTIYPIHTEHADQFASLSGMKIQMPRLEAE